MGRSWCQHTTHLEIFDRPTSRLRLCVWGWGGWWRAVSRRGALDRNGEVLVSTHDSLRIRRRQLLVLACVSSGAALLQACASAPAALPTPTAAPAQKPGTSSDWERIL